MVLETSNGKVLETSLVCNNIILKNRGDFRAQAEEVWRIVPTLQSHNCFLVQSITFNHWQEIIFGSFSFVPPPVRYAPEVTEHVRLHSKSSCKNMARLSGGCK